MSSEYRGPYIIRDDASAGDEEAEAWVAPEPAADVIVEEVVAATDLSREAVEPLEDYVDFDELADVLEGDGGAVTFDVEAYEVAVTHDGSVEVVARE